MGGCGGHQQRGDDEQLFHESLLQASRSVNVNLP
jgi:hypothetical protein